MMEMTTRLNLPLLAVAQAAKEMTVNESLTTLDAAVQPVIEAEASTPPASPEIGQGWLVGADPTGAFAGHAGSLAVWTVGGWRFVAPFEGMAVWHRGSGTLVRRRSGNWQSGFAVSVPSGGTTIDNEARAAIEAIVARIRDFGIIAA
jgi:hypothetical protein